MHDLILDREELLAMSNKNILKALQDMYPARKLYSISTGWRESKEYILKARGTGGDLIVGWGERKAGISGKILTNKSNPCKLKS